MIADSFGHLGEGSNGEPIPRDDLMDSGREKKKWSSLFGTRPTGKSSLPPVKNISDPSGGKFAISIPYQVLDHNINSMSNSLVGKFMGSHHNIEVVRAFVKQKWAHK